MTVYRIAGSADAAALAELRWDFRRENARTPPVHSKDEFLQACSTFFAEGIKRRDWVHWAAESDGMLIACISVYVLVKIPKPDALHDAFGYVTNVYTRPAYRNRRIGSHLMERVVEWAKEQNLEELIVWPSERSIPFYERAGFVEDVEALRLELRPYIA